MGIQDSIPSRQHRLSSNQPTIALITTSLALFFIAFMVSALNVALPVVNKEFNADAILLSWVATSQFLTVAVFSLPFGRIADIIGLKKIILAGLVLYSATSVLAALAGSAITLIIARAIQGIGGAMMFGTTTALLVALYPAERRGRALGIHVATLYVGMSVAPFLGGLMTEHLGWRSIFFTNVPAGLLAAALIWWKIKGEWSGSRGEKFDIPGAIIYGIAIVALMYGFSLLPDVGGIVLTLIGILGIFTFLRWEDRARSPMLNISMFRESKVFLFSNIATLLNYSATTGEIFLLSLFLQYIKGLTPSEAGLIMLAQPASQAIFSPISGRLSDRLHPRKVAAAGMVLIFIAFVLLSLLTQHTPVGLIVAILLLLGIGVALFVSPNTNAVMSSVVPKYYGIASATSGTMRTIGHMLSMGIVMIVISLVVGRVVIAPEHYPNFVIDTKLTFAIFSVFCLAGVFASYYGRKSDVR